MMPLNRRRADSIRIGPFVVYVGVGVKQGKQDVFMCNFKGGHAGNVCISSVYVSCCIAVADAFYIEAEHVRG